MDSNKIALVKLLTTTVIGAGVSKVVDGIVENNVDPEDLNRFGKIQVKGARFALAGAIAVQTKKYTDTVIDEMVEAVNKLKNIGKPTDTNEK